MSGGSITIRRATDPEPEPQPLPPVPTARRLAILLPAFLLLATGIVLNLFEGGYGRAIWGGVALFVLALFLLVLLLTPPARRGRSKAFDLAVLCLGLLTLWSYASILWANVPADAWEGANRTLLYWLAFTVIGLRSWSPEAARDALTLVAVGTGVLAIGVLFYTGAADEQTAQFVGGRLSEPVGYANALANAWLIAFWPALHLAIARDHPWWLRAAGLGSATLLLQTALLSQSRGAVLAFALTAAIFLLLHPRHWAALLALAFPLGALALGWDVLTEVRLSANGGELDESYSEALRWIVLSSLFGITVGGLAGMLGPEMAARGLSSTSLRRTGDRVFLGLAGALALVGVLIAFASTGWIDARWDDFRSNDQTAADAGETRFGGSLGSGRYDFYRVALNEFRDHPIAGIGVENFGVEYLQERRTIEAPRYAHSLGFSLLAQLGIIGAGLFIAFLAFCLLPLARRGWPRADRGMAVGAAGGAIMWLTHGQVDWLWEYPALAIVALGLLAIACRLGDPDHTGDEAPPRRGEVRWMLRSAGPRAVVGLLALAAAVSFALPGAAARLERSAAEVASRDPETAMSRLDRAANIDPLSADPLISRSILARGRGETDVARADLQEALRREPANWYAHFELALLDGQAGAFEPAAAALRRASELNPRQPLIAEVRDLILQRKRVDPVQVERVLSGQLSVRLQPFDPE